MAEKQTYPKRPKFFAHRYCRLLTKTCAAQDIGHIAFVLCVTIVNLEDSKRYGGPVSFYNDQLLPIIGVRKWDSLDSARRKAVEGGWLHYENRGKRKPGIYWVTVPPSVLDCADSGCDENHSELYPSHGDNAGDSLNSLYPTSYPRNGDSHGDNAGDSHGDSHGDNAGDSHGDNAGDRGGEPPTLSLTLRPGPCPDPAPKKDEPIGSSKKVSSSRQLRFEETDRATAEWMFGLVLALDPKVRKPNLDAWANEIRLTREIDGRTDDEIRGVFGWANADSFWRSNILSPAKLRKQFTTLYTKMKEPQSNGRGNKQMPCGPGQSYTPGAEVTPL